MCTLHILREENYTRSMLFFTEEVEDNDRQKHTDPARSKSGRNNIYKALCVRVFFAFREYL